MRSRTSRAPRGAPQCGGRRPERGAGRRARPRTAPRSGSSARPRSRRFRTGARRSRRSCTARGTWRPAAPRAREARWPAAGSLARAREAVHDGLEGVRRGTPVEPLTVHEEGRSPLHARALALLEARLDAAGVALAVQARVILLEVEPHARGEAA